MICMLSRLFRKRAEREREEHGKKNAIPTESSGSCQLVLSKRKKNTTNGGTVGEKEISPFHGALDTEDQRKCLVCDNCKQKYSRVVGSEHSSDK